MMTVIEEEKEEIPNFKHTYHTLDEEEQEVENIYKQFPLKVLEQRVALLRSINESRNQMMNQIMAEMQEDKKEIMTITKVIREHKS